MSRRARTACGALAFAALIAAPAGASTTTTTPTRGAPVVEGIGLRLVDVPVRARSDPRAQVYIVDRLAPGTTIHRRVEVSNSSASAQHVALYAGGATIAHGRFIGDEGHTQNDLSTWTSVSPESSDLRAGAQLAVPVTLRVPRDAAPGEQYAVVWAEVRSAALPSGVTEVSRVGIRLYVSVGSGGPPASNFVIDSLTAERSPSGRPAIIGSVRNTGGRALDMNGTLQLSNGPGGLRAGPFTATLGTTLAIGDGEPVTFLLDRQIPAGPWSALVTLHSGLLERRARATVTFPRAGASRAVKAQPIGRNWLYPGAAALGAFVLLGGGALALTSRYRR